MRGLPRRILITGASGFVGGHLIAALRRRDPKVELVATGLHGQPDAAGLSWRVLDITDRPAVEALVGSVRPDAIVHLAALATYGASARDPDLAWQVNVGGTRHLAEAALRLVPQAAFLHVSSSEVYGYACNDHASVDESVRLDPGNVYAVTKAAADLAIGEMARRGLKAVRLRPFNHTGAGQGEALFVPTMAAQIARIEAGLAAGPVIRVGNLEAERDFLDVRDVVEAYGAALEAVPRLPPGAVFNLASGTPRRMGTILDQLLAKARLPIRIEQDPARMRPSEVARICGAATAARTAFGWQPAISFDATLDAVLADWRGRVAREGTSANKESAS